ncbi:MAG TPA: RelA/SpoT domain-containing protein [Candidatus Sulfotelmatobacter sp.]|jgi:ppGpp synthetase/RelA/SpoT-type nucleotidyltranferase|nr:RelA/SpoT domain-containing protein [Candidatus Sulfotelmatobacter sp.]
MAWSILQHSTDAVDAAGAFLANADKQPNSLDWNLDLVLKYDESLAIINNWRACHNFPLNTFQIGLRRRAKQVEHSSLIVQRTKRLSSISLKLQRFPKLKLSEMQDIGGCRAIVHTVAHVEKLVKNYSESQIKHKQIDFDNYINNPKPSGYRGHHLIYSYYSDKKTTYNGRKIEIQIRTQLQHAWATAVETVGTFTKQALKSSRGEADWLRFFALMGTAIAVRENSPPVPKTPDNTRDLKSELVDYAKKLDVENRLQVYGAALQTLEQPSLADAHYFLLKLDPSPNAPTVQITGYKQMELEKASKEYLDIEKAISKGTHADAVLVSAESFANLRRAYPNYFLDTKEFLAALRQAIA